ncbi:hypothetical protein JCM3774_000818 [Rhodotorula dairenensis]
MATDGALSALLLASACALGGLLTGILLAGPLVAVPALFASPSLSVSSRLHVWSRLEAETTKLVGSILPLVTASLALCALLARSADPTRRTTYLEDDLGGWIGATATLVAENRRSLFVLAAILTLAVRPYSFGLLTPRVEALKAEERRLLLLGLARGSTGLDRALGRSGWRGASPALEEKCDEQNEAGNGAEENGNGNETDEEDNDLDDEIGNGMPITGTARVKDTDRLILELSRLQLGLAILCGAAFALTVLNFVCS